MILRIWPLVSKWDSKFPLIRKEDFGPLSNRPGVFFFSPGFSPRFWRCLLLRNGLTRGIRHLKSMSRTRLCVVALDAMTQASVHSLWKSPTLLNGLFLTILSRLGSSLLLVHLFLPHFSLPHNFLFMYFWYSTLGTPNFFYNYLFEAFPPYGGCQ